MSKISDRLAELKILSGAGISTIFDDLYADILDIEIITPSQTVAELWSRFDNVTPSLNGAVFEAILATLFYRLGIAPLYVQASITFVPNVDFDFVAYSHEYGPIILSAKTSLRERYKQADLEGMMLRQVHRRAKSYLITLHEVEAASTNRKIEEGKVLGLDSVILATSPAFDELIIELQGLNFYKPAPVDVLTSKRLIG